MSNEERIEQLESRNNNLLARLTAAEAMLSTLMVFINVPPLVAEVALQKAADQEADAMQQDESARESLPAFLAAIDVWQMKLQQWECIDASPKDSTP